MNQAEWMNDPLVAGIDRTKLEFLQTLVFEGKNLTREQMLPFLMAVAQRSRESSVSFSDGEMEAIIAALRKYSTPEELSMINRIMAMKKTR